MGLSASRAGHDVVTRHTENRTHLEINTRRIIAKTGGFRLFDIHAEGAGTGITHPGISGIGVVGEVFLVLTALAIAFWIFKRIMAYRIRHESYKGFYRDQAADHPFGLAVPPRSDPALEYYGPNNARNPSRDLAQLSHEVKELKKARRKMENHLAATRQATVTTIDESGAAGGARRKKRDNVYQDSE